MPQRGERVRDFHHDVEDAPPRIGIREVWSTESSGRKRRWSFDPAGFICRALAGQLADEWMEYANITACRGGTTRGYRQSAEAFCAFVDAELGEAAAQASIAVPQPDLGAVLLAWERSLPPRFPLGSTRPAFITGNVRTLINRRGQHPDRPVAANLAGVAAGQHTLHWGTRAELDEFTRAEKAALVAAAWKESEALMRRLAAGRALAERGGHPEQHGWLKTENLLWALAHDAVGRTRRLGRGRGTDG